MAEGSALGEPTSSVPVGARGGAGGKTGGPGGIGGVVGAVGIGDVLSDRDQLSSRSSNNSDIFVQSFGANLGEIIAPFIQGSPENGGDPIGFAGSPLSTGLGLRTPLGAINVPAAALLIGGAAVLVTLLVQRRRRR